jgi:regulation of enolase protein 1 (concanavalin A-like superfamily)
MRWFVLTASFLLWPLVASAETRRVLFEEPFGERPGDGWSWHNEDPSRHRVEAGKLVVQTNGGSWWAKNKDAKNDLVRDAPAVAGEIAIEVFIEITPDAPFEHAGLAWFYDEDNYVTLNKEFFSGREKMLFVVERAGKGEPPYAEIPYNEKGVWLRLRVDGETITGQFRAPDSDDWQTAGKRKLPGAGAAKIALHSGYAPKKEPPREVTFSRFRITAVEK